MDVDVETFIKAAGQHGADGEPDHEIRDLQDHLRTAFRLLTPEQKAAYLSMDEIIHMLETAMLLDIDANASPSSLADRRGPHFDCRQRRPCRPVSSHNC